MLESSLALFKRVALPCRPCGRRCTRSGASASPQLLHERAGCSDSSDAWCGGASAKCCGRSRGPCRRRRSWQPRFHLLISWWVRTLLVTTTLSVTCYFCAQVVDAQYRQLRNSTGCLAPAPNRDSLHNVSDPRLAFDATSVLTWARLATAGLRAERGRIDDLNVFPVADSDTGTNLLLTFVDGATALEEHLTAAAAQNQTVGAGEALVTLARAALRGARGSSGTILSQILLGFATEVADQDIIHRADFARAQIGRASW